MTTVLEHNSMLALNLGEEDSGAVCDYLARAYGIYTRSGGHCAPLMHKALGIMEQTAVQLSISSFNRLDGEQAERALWELNDAYR